MIEKLYKMAQRNIRENLFSWIFQNFSLQKLSLTNYLLKNISQLPSVYIHRFIYQFLIILSFCWNSFSLMYAMFYVSFAISKIWVILSSRLLKLLTFSQEYLFNFHTHIQVFNNLFLFYFCTHTYIIEL